MQYFAQHFSEFAMGGNLIRGQLINPEITPTPTPSPTPTISSTDGGWSFYY